MRALVSLALLTALGAVASAQSNLILQGVIDKYGPTFRGPNRLGEEGFYENNGYTVTPFTVSVSGDYTAEMSTFTLDAIRTRLLIYRNSFDPRNPLVNIVNVADGDTPVQQFTVLPNTLGNQGPFGSQIKRGTADNMNANGLPLVTGTVYFAVASSTYPVDTSNSFGRYNLGIGGGPGNVTAVPEPATIAALGLGGLALLRRRRKSA